MVREQSVTLVVHDVGPVGGMERHAWELISGLLSHGWDVTVIAFSCSIPPHPRLRVFRVRGPKRPFPLAYPWFMIASWLLVRLRGRGLVHTHGAVTAKTCDVSTVHFCHQAVRALRLRQPSSKATMAFAVSAWISGWLKIAGERFVYRNGGVRSLIAISRGVDEEASTWLSAPGRRVVRIPHGVDHATFQPNEIQRSCVRARLGIAPDAQVAVFVGGEWDRKGLRTAITAISSSANWTLIVVGTGDTAEYEAYARAAGASVKFLGKQANTAPFYAAADAFVFPTRYETFSLAAHEAAASGLPLLCGRAHGIDELITDGVNGWFVDPDDAASLSRHLNLLRDNPELRRTMGAAARRASKPYSWERTVALHERLYLELAAAS